MNENSRIYRAIDIIYDGVVNKDYDNVLCITGDEGKGKTHIGLHIVDEWLRRRYGTVTPEMAGKFIGMDGKGFVKVLGGVKRFDIAMNDEAADISSRGALEKVNKLFMKAYQIIRGDNLFTILIIPSVFDLDSFFRKRRVRHLIHVYKRGKFAYWGHERLKRMVEQNERFPVKNYYVVRPLFYDNLPKYDGVLLNPYLKIKEDKMLKVRELLSQELAEDVPRSVLKEAQAMKNVREKFGLNITQTAKIFGYGRQVIGERLKLLKGEGAEDVG